MSLETGVIRATAFLTRSIRQESRQLSHHFMRGALALVILSLFAAQLSISATTGAAGYSFARTIASACYWFLTVVGMLYFAIAVTEEKEEDTLPLIRMTGVSNFAFLTGKSVPRIAIAALFLLVITPFIVLSITMGGVVIENLLALLIGMLCYAFLLSQIGLLSSVIASDSRRALSLAGFLWFMFELGDWIVWPISFGFTAWNYPFLAESATTIGEAIRSRSMFYASGEYLMMIRGDSILHPQMSFHLIAGVVCFLLSLLLFERFSARAIGLGLAGNTPRRFKFWNRSKRLSVRAVQPALPWKSWYFITGGRRWFLLKLFGFPLLTGLGFAAICIIVDEALDMEVLAVFLIVTGVALTIIETARAMGRVLNEEIFRQTLGTLLMLPRTLEQTIWPLVGGVLPVIVPPLSCLLVGVLLLSAAEPRFLKDLVESMAEPWFWHFLSWFVLTTHLGILLSTMLRYGGMLVAVAIMWIAAPMLFVMFMMTVAFMLTGIGRGADWLFEFLLPTILIVLECVMCVVVQRAIIRRLQNLAQQS